MGNYFDDVILTLDVTGGTTPVDFSCDITAATLTPDTPEEIRKRLCGQRTVTGTTTWTLELTLDQNWATATPGPHGLSLFLWEHAGELADFVIQWPLEATEATGVVRLKPGPFGGTAGEIAEGDVTLGLDGQPTFGPITPVADEPPPADEPDEDDVPVAYEKAAAA